MTRPAHWIAAALAAWLVSACGQKVALGGDATETGNARVSGQVVREDGLPVVGAEVTILASDFNPAGGTAVPDSQKDTTDVDGRYRFARLQDGKYNLLARHAETRTRSILFDIDLAAADSVTVPEDTLHAPGAISVPLPETLDSGVGYVYVPGTTYRKRVDSELRIVGSVILDSLPPGLMPSVAYGKGDADSRPIVLAADVAVHSSEVTYVNAYAVWSHSAKLALNTSGSGAATSKDQTDFPLLVRLTAPAFDFSQAAAGGADLRFAKRDGTPLTREIQSWDAKAGRAEIWVRVDTVHANDASQFITMHWGAQNAAAPRARRPVFDTLAGFSGVWHLEEDAADTAANGLYRDATGAGGNGNDRIANVSRSGLIGAGHGLDSGDYMVAPKVYGGAKTSAVFTLSIWFRTSGKGMGPVGGEMISLGDNYGIRVNGDGMIHLWYWPPTQPAGLATPWYEVNVKDAKATDGNWHQVFGTFDGANLRLYGDGEELGNAATPAPVGFLFPVNVTLGKHGNGKPGYEYKGDLDEAEVHSAVRDADWIKMSFANQKAGAVFPAISGL
ncbi:MAG: hypothetical protein JWO30_396 [Fibrobacteres bacterium]|nr:hypothetical protein [Fibrobacterota bacterium]